MQGAGRGQPQDKKPGKPQGVKNQHWTQTQYYIFFMHLLISSPQMYNMMFFFVTFSHPLNKNM